jgi:hypothetical protein
MPWTLKRFIAVNECLNHHSLCSHLYEIPLLCCPKCGSFDRVVVAAHEVEDWAGSYLIHSGYSKTEIEPEVQGE